MSRVAIAGGTSSGLGRSITKGIINAYPNGEWKPIILSRSDTVPKWLATLPNSSYELHKVDYSSPASLDQALKSCHTVISVILGRDETHTTNQIALLDAALRCGCKRFAPSEWASGPAGTMEVTLLKMAKPPVWDACDNSGIEWARFNVGSFINYLAIGCSEDSYVEDEACAGVDREGDMPDGSGSFLLSLKSATVEVPLTSDGDYPAFTMTEINNVGEFVAAALELEKWERDMNIVGSTIRMDKLISLAENLIEKAIKVDKISKDSIKEELEGLDPEDFMKRLWLELKLVVGNDTDGQGILAPVVNRLCPQVSAVDVESFLRRHR